MKFFSLKLILLNLFLFSNISLAFQVTHIPTAQDFPIDISEDKQAGELRTFRFLVETSLGQVKFQIHTTKDQVELVESSLPFIRQDVVKVVEYFKYAPSSSIHIQLVSADSANGSATVFPVNKMSFNNFPPVTGDYLAGNRHWIRTLVIHELTHIVHMDLTTGILKGFRNIFGSAFKWGGVVPRWFTEGIAVWVESHFTGDGRLNNGELHYDLLSAMLANEQCQALACLDEPMVYPFGHLPYWMGGFFVDYLENKKAGTISCLVQANSDSIPFFLNDAFKECVGQDAANSFLQFRIHFLEKYRQDHWKINDQRRQSLNAKNIPAKNFISWQKGLVAKEQWSVQVQIEDKFEKLVWNDLKTGISYQQRFDLPILRLQNIPSSPTQILITFSNFGRGPLNKQTIIFDLATQQKVKDLTAWGDYNFITKDGGHLLFVYHQSSWKLFALNNIVEKKSDLLKLKPIHTFKNLESILNVALVEKNGVEWLVWESFLAKEQVKVSRWMESPIKEWHTPVEIFTTEESLSFSGACGENLAFFDNKNKQIYLWNNQFNKLTSYKSEEYSDIAGLNMSPSWTLLRLIPSAKQPFIYQNNCQQFLSEWLDKENFSTINLPAPNVSNEEKKNSLNFKSWDSYPSISHFAPQYWIFLYNFGGSLESLQLTTGLGDPLGRHTVGLDYLYYPTISKSGHGLSYTYARDWFYVYPKLEKSYSKSSFSEEGNEQDSKSGTVGAKWTIGDWHFLPALRYEKSKAVDFVSKRELDRFILRDGFVYFSQVSDALVKNTVVNTSVFYQQTKNLKNFWGFQAKWLTEFNLTKKIGMHTQLSYGRLYKDDFRSGVLYGGGSSSTLLGDSYFFEFYGVPYSDIFGNKILSSRLQWDYSLGPVKTDGSLFPFRVKEWKALIGGEYIESERVYLDNQLKRDPKLFSLHTGLRLNSTAFYLLPIDIDVLLAKVLNSSDQDQTQFMALIKGSFF